MDGTEMSPEERRQVIKAMSDNFDRQDAPKVGIFWYDAEHDELFGVNKITADELRFNENGFKTIGLLHKSWWQKEQKRALVKGKAGIFAKDYTAIPRGRIFQRADGVFQLMCGTWITDHIEALVKEEFDLQHVPFERTIDIHWELGHGWSDEHDF